MHGSHGGRGKRTVARGRCNCRRRRRRSSSSGTWGGLSARLEVMGGRRSGTCGDSKRNEGVRAARVGEDGPPSRVVLLLHLCRLLHLLMTEVWRCAPVTRMPHVLPVPSSPLRWSRVLLLLLLRGIRLGMALALMLLMLMPRGGRRPVLRVSGAGVGAGSILPRAMSSHAAKCGGGN